MCFFFKIIAHTWHGNTETFACLLDSNASYAGCRGPFWKKHNSTIIKILKEFKIYGW